MRNLPMHDEDSRDAQAWGDLANKLIDFLRVP